MKKKILLITILIILVMLTANFLIKNYADIKIQPKIYTTYQDYYLDADLLPANWWVDANPSQFGLVFGSTLDRRMPRSTHQIFVDRESAQGTDDNAYSSSLDEIHTKYLPAAIDEEMVRRISNIAKRHPYLDNYFVSCISAVNNLVELEVYACKLEIEVGEYYEVLHVKVPLNAKEDVYTILSGYLKNFSKTQEDYKKFFELEPDWDKRTELPCPVRIMVSYSLQGLKPEIGEINCKGENSVDIKKPNYQISSPLGFIVNNNDGTTVIQNFDKVCNCNKYYFVSKDLTTRKLLFEIQNHYNAPLGFVNSETFIYAVSKSTLEDPLNNIMDINKYNISTQKNETVFEGLIQSGLAIDMENQIIYFIDISDKNKSVLKKYSVLDGKTEIILETPTWLAELDFSPKNGLLFKNVYKAFGDSLIDSGIITSELIQLDLNTKKLTRLGLLEDGRIYFPKWSNDGSYVAFRFENRIVIFSPYTIAGEKKFRSLAAIENGTPGEIYQIDWLPP